MRRISNIIAFVLAGLMTTVRLAEAGVDVRMGVSVRELRRAYPYCPVALGLDDGTELEVDEVLFATGRKPLTDHIGLETVGLTPGSWLDVDDTCRVRAVDDGWLYAAGDVIRHALLTHQGKYQARIAGAAIGARAAGSSLDTKPWGAHVITADHHAVPQAFFTDPEAAALIAGLRAISEKNTRGEFTIPPELEDAHGAVPEYGFGFFDSRDELLDRTYFSDFADLER